jgi:hypothetical protein
MTEQPERPAPGEAPAGGEIPEGAPPPPQGAPPPPLGAPPPGAPSSPQGAPPPPGLPVQPGAAPAYAPPLPAGGAGPAVGELAIKRGLGRVIGFSVLSFGIYTYYWFYVTRKQLNSELGSTDDAGLYTAGLLVPILNVIITYWLWRDLNELRRRLGLPEFNVVLWIVLAMFVPFAALVIYLMIVNRLNEYWDVRTQGAAVTAPVTSGEKIVIGIGIGIWALLALIVIAIIVAVAAS